MYRLNNKPVYSASGTHPKNVRTVNDPDRQMDAEEIARSVKYHGSAESNTIDRRKLNGKARYLGRRGRKPKYS